jgi:hypothetical protein
MYTNMRKFLTLALVGVSAQIHGMEFLDSAARELAHILPGKIVRWLRQPMSAAEKVVANKIQWSMTALSIAATLHVARDLYLEHNNPYEVLPRSKIYIMPGEDDAHELCVRINKKDILHSPEFTKIDWESGYGKHAIDMYLESYPFMTRTGQELNISKNMKHQRITHYLQGKTTSLISDVTHAQNGEQLRYRQPAP